MDISPLDEVKEVMLLLLRVGRLVLTSESDIMTFNRLSSISFGFEGGTISFDVMLAGEVLDGSENLLLVVLVATKRLELLPSWLARLGRVPLFS